MILLGATLPDGPRRPSLARWRGDAAFRGATVVLSALAAGQHGGGGPGCHVEILRGQRASDAVGRMRAQLVKHAGRAE